MTRIIHLGADNSSDRTADGGIQPSGPRGAVTQYTSGAGNVIQFPSGRRFLPDSQDSGSEPFILSFDIREIGTLFLAAALVLVTLGFCASVVFLYLTLIG